MAEIICPITIIKHQDFIEEVIMRGRKVIIINGNVQYNDHDALVFGYSEEGLLMLGNFVNQILCAITRTKHAKAKYDHDHRTTDQKNPNRKKLSIHIDNHPFNESDSSPACTICGMAADAECHKPKG